jgi:hypothetical protein
MKARTRLPLSRVTDYGLRSPRRETAPRPTRQSGTAVIVVLVIIAILMIYVAGNIRTLHNVGKELKLIEQKQVHRLDKLQTSNSKPQGNSKPQTPNP